MSAENPRSFFRAHLALLCAVAASLAANVLALFVLTISRQPVELETRGEDCSPFELMLASPMKPSEAQGDVEPLPAEPKPTPFTLQNFLSPEAFELTQPDLSKFNAFADTEEGGTELRPDGPKSGGGGGDGADAPEAGHIAHDDKVWARMKWKSDPGAKDKIAGDENGRGATVPGTLKAPGSGDGLGNGRGSGALGSQGSGTGSGAGLNGSNSGNGMGTAKPLGATRRPEVLSMNRGVYPPEARNARHEGSVVLNVEVLPGGNVGRVEVRATSGYKELDDAALAAMKDWRFTGALRDGNPVSFWYAIPFRFVLTEQ